MIGVFWLFILYHLYPFEHKNAKPIICLSCLMLGYCFGGDMLAKTLYTTVTGDEFRNANATQNKENKENKENVTGSATFIISKAVKRQEYLSKKVTFFVFAILAIWLYWAFSRS